MDFTPFLGIIGTALLTLVAYFVRTQMIRLDELEKNMTTKMTDNEVRQILEDKIEPLKESMAEVKLKVDKVIDLLIQK